MAADALGQLEAWFVCGSQHMYGAEQRMGAPATVTYLPDARSRRGYARSMPSTCASTTHSAAVATT